MDRPMPTKNQLKRLIHIDEHLESRLTTRLNLLKQALRTLVERSSTDFVEILNVDNTINYYGTILDQVVVLKKEQAKEMTKSDAFKEADITAQQEEAAKLGEHQA